MLSLHCHKITHCLKLKLSKYYKYIKKTSHHIMKCVRATSGKQLNFKFRILFDCIFHNSTYSIYLVCLLIVRE